MKNIGWLQRNLVLDCKFVIVIVTNSKIQKLNCKPVYFNCLGFRKQIIDKIIEGKPIKIKTILLSLK